MKSNFPLYVEGQIYLLTGQGLLSIAIKSVDGIKFQTFKWGGGLSTELAKRLTFANTYFRHHIVSCGSFQLRKIVFGKNWSLHISQYVFKTILGRNLQRVEVMHYIFNNYNLKIYKLQNYGKECCIQNFILILNSLFSLFVTFYNNYIYTYALIMT